MSSSVCCPRSCHFCLWLSCLQAPHKALFKDADLIEILWKQDVDLGIPLEDYRPTVPAGVNASTSFKQDKLGASPDEKKAKRDFQDESAKERKSRSIDAETGEPIFENMPGPSTIDAILNCNSSDLDISDLIGAVNEELFSSDWVNDNGFSDGSGPPYNGSDPFGGVLLQNVSLPSSIEAAAENVTAPDSYGQYRPITTTLLSPTEVSKSTVTDHQAMRDLLTYNSTTNCGLDSFELFNDDLVAMNSTTAAPAAATPSNQNQRTTICKETGQHTFTAMMNNRTASGKSPGNYAGSDTGVSSMYSDEGNEEWMESASDSSQHDRDSGHLASADLSYNSSCTSTDMCMLPQKKYNFFGRKPPYPSYGEHDSAATPLQGYMHNHTYSRESADPQFLIKHEQPMSSNETASQDLRFDGYDSSDPSDFNSIQVTSARDERRARELGIPISTEDIVTLSIDEFNERLARYELSDEQHALIRDIRRRGKNKVAAQNCRKRKLDQISALQEDVDRLHHNCRSLEAQNDGLTRREAFAHHKLTQLRDLISESSGAIPKVRPIRLED